MSGIEGPGVIGGGGAADWNTLANRPQQLVDIGDGTPVNLTLLTAQVQTSLDMTGATSFIDGANVHSVPSVATNNLGAPGSINNQALPAAGQVWRVTTDNGNNTFTGVAAPATADRVIQLQNIGGTGTLTLTHQDAASDAANRFICPNNASVVIRPGGGVILKYDNTASRWRIQTVL